MGKLGLLVRFFLFVRCTYTYTCEVCNKVLGISMQTNAPVTPPHVYALSSQNTHLLILIHTTLRLQILAISKIIWTCFFLQGHFCLGKWVTILALVLLWILLEGQSTYRQFPWNELCLQSAGLMKYFLDGTEWVRILVTHYVFLEIY